jgi:BirA family biotin operon repressor/biotin-[acetyl-CoA-carboxylase] ligase
MTGQQHFGIAPDLARAEEAIGARGGRLGRPLHLLRETPSTNDEAKHGAKSGAPHGSTWVAESQTDGRGRQGRTWISPRGENLLFSVLVRVKCAATRLPLISLVAGLAVLDAARRVAPSTEIQLKWPNDVVVSSGARDEDRLLKLAGILVETFMVGSTVDAVIVGVGINVHTRVFPDAIAHTATSLARIATRPLDRAEILADVLEGLDRDVELVVARGLGVVHARLREHDALLGRRVRSDEREGIARGIDLEGRLVVERDGTLAAWSAGEVHLAPSGGKLDSLS